MEWTDGWSCRFVLAALAIAFAGCGSEAGVPAPAATVATPGPSSPEPSQPEPGEPGGASEPAIVPGEPITAPEKRWTWIDVAGTACADGSQAGVGVNLTSASNDVLVFFEGGGACWDGATCWGSSTAINVSTGYARLQWATDAQRLLYVLSRADVDNPFRDVNMVFVPYCTGDAFSGDRVTTLSFLGINHETHFVGSRNVGVIVPRLLGTFPNAKRVWLAGDSAGGFGAAFNLGRFQQGFTGARVDVLDDSGHPIDPKPETWNTWRTAWNMQLPPDCPACAQGLGGFVDYYRTKYPNSRFGLISYEYDTVIAPFMNLSFGEFHSRLYEVLDKFDASWTNGRYFVQPGAAHVGLIAPSKTLKDWIKKMATDAPSWGSVRP